jgi:DNA-binding MarR family transcriptional regulator
MTTTSEQDAFVVLEALVKQQIEAEEMSVDQVDSELNGEALREATGLDPHRINRAITLLVGEGYAEVVRSFGNAPYEFVSVRATPFGRVEYERSLAEAIRAEDAAQREESDRGDVSRGEAESGRQEESDRGDVPTGEAVFIVHGRDAGLFVIKSRESSSGLVSGRSSFRRNRTKDERSSRSSKRRH